MSTETLPLITKEKHLRGMRVLLRTSLDVPIENGVVTNQFRLMQALPTIRHLIHEGAKVILITHIGRDPQETVAPLLPILKKHMPVSYVPDLLGDAVREAVSTLADGEVLLLENLRSVPGETENDERVSRRLASYADMYVNDAFAVSHRAHASIVGVPEHLHSTVGLNFFEEYSRLSRVLTPHHPALFILGGAKFETKQPLVERYLKEYDRVFVGGALANDFFKSMGYEVGTSVIGDTALVGNKILNDPKLLLPVDVTVDGPRGIRVTKPTEVAHDEKILDAGPETIRMLLPHVCDAKTILWNGPLGFYEGGFAECTLEVGKMIAKESKAYSVLGGGDTIAAIESLGLHDRYSFVSTAGGAMLEFLEKGTLPGIEAIRSAQT